MIQRDSNFELLRILCMVFIIAEHMAKSMVIESFWGNSISYYSLNFLKSFTIVAVNCYILISGYFGIHFKFGKLAKLSLLVLFYSLLYLCINYLRCGSFEIRSDIKYIFPITADLFWFVGSYYVLYFLSSTLNKLVSIINIKDHITILCLCFVLFYLWPSIAYLFNFYQVIGDAGYGPVNFISLYLIGRFIRLYVKPNNAFPRRSFWWWGAYAISSCLLFAFQSFYSSILHFSFTSFFCYNTLFVLIASICLFMAFCELNIESKLINCLAKYCFSAYIIHYLFLDYGAFHLKSFNPFILPIVILLFSAVVYLICILIDSLRVFVFNRIENQFVNWLSRKSIINAIEKRIIAIEQKA